MVNTRSQSQSQNQNKNKIFVFLKYIYKNSIIKEIIKFLLIIIGLGIAHWGLIQFYAYYCAQWSFWGPLLSFLSIGSPLCQFINYLQYEISKYYTFIWRFAATSCIYYIIKKCSFKNHIE